MTARTTWLMSGIGLCAFALAFAFLLFPVSPASAAGGGDKGEKAEEKKGPKLLKSTDELLAQPLPWEYVRADEERCTTEEIVVLRELRERAEQLNMREAALDERERSIADAEHLLALRLAKIESIRSDIVGKLDAEREGILKIIRAEQEARQSQAVAEQTARIQKAAAEQTSRLKRIEEEQAVVLAAIARDQELKDERIEELSGIVATMKPKAAAAMLAGMDETVALRVLLNLTPKSAGRVLAAMPAGVSQRLGDRMTVHKDPRRGSNGAPGAGTKNDAMNLPGRPAAGAAGTGTTPNSN